MVILPFSDGSEDYTLAPSKILALGLNYREHITESISVQVTGAVQEIPEEPVIFPMTSNALIGSGESIVIPRFLEDYSFEAPRVDHEAELAFIVKDQCKNIPAEEAYDHILGFTCLNDVSQRNLQTSDKAGWYRGKSLDTFCPVGPVIVKPEDFSAAGLDPEDLAVSCRVNGRTAQQSRTSAMIFSIPEIVAFLSRCFTLYPGDLISTGTPSGVGPLEDGDVVEVEVEGIGILRNPVIREK